MSASFLADFPNRPDELHFDFGGPVPHEFNEPEGESPYSPEGGSIVVNKNAMAMLGLGGGDDDDDDDEEEEVDDVDDFDDRTNIPEPAVRRNVGASNGSARNGGVTGDKAPSPIELRSSSERVATTKDGMYDDFFARNEVRLNGNDENDNVEEEEEEYEIQHLEPTPREEEMGEMEEAPAIYSPAMSSLTTDYRGADNRGADNRGILSNISVGGQFNPTLQVQTTQHSPYQRQQQQQQQQQPALSPGKRVMRAMNSSIPQLPSPTHVAPMQAPVAPAQTHVAPALTSAGQSPTSCTTIAASAARARRAKQQTAMVARQRTKAAREAPERPASQEASEPMMNVTLPVKVFSRKTDVLEREERMYNTTPREESPREESPQPHNRSPNRSPSNRSPQRHIPPQPIVSTGVAKRGNILKNRGGGRVRAPTGTKSNLTNVEYTRGKNQNLATNVNHVARNAARSKARNDDGVKVSERWSKREDSVRDRRLKTGIFVATYSRANMCVTEEPSSSRPQGRPQGPEPRGPAQQVGG